jgi:hypothetical protein
MGLHRRQLRVLDPCDVFEPGEEVDFCRVCSKRVHDLSQMTRRQATRLLRRHTGGTLCVAYRCRPDGTVKFRPVATAATWSAFASLLAACTGWVEPEELHLPGDVCFDADGHEIGCDKGEGGYARIPSQPRRERPRLDKEPTVPGTQEAAGCPVIPHSTNPRPSTARVRVEPVEGTSGGPHVRVDFQVNTDDDFFRGIVVADYDSVDRSGPYGRLKFRPTRDLWAELRERIRARHRTRKRRR